MVEARVDVDAKGTAIARSAINTRGSREERSGSHGNPFIDWSVADNIGLGCIWISVSGAGVGVEVEVEAEVDGALSLPVVEGFCSSWHRCAISLLMLEIERGL